MSKKIEMKSPQITIGELIEVKRLGAIVRKASPSGLTTEEYGQVYDIGNYRVIVKGTPEEIERRLKEAEGKKR